MVHWHNLLQVHGALQCYSEAPLTPEAVWLFNEVNEQPCLTPVFSRLNSARAVAGLESVRKDMEQLSFATKWTYLIPSIFIVLPQ